MKFDVQFYETENGERPVEEFVFSLDEKMQAKFIGLIDLLEVNGTNLREPYSKHLEDGIFELRCKVGNNTSRAMFFFYYNQRIVFTNAFIKKTRKTPRNEIRLAKERRKKYMQREENNG